MGCLMHSDMIDMAAFPEKKTPRKTTETMDWRYQAMDRNTRCRVCSARKGQKRVESLGVPVSDLRSSVMRMDLGKARHDWGHNQVHSIKAKARTWGSRSEPGLRLRSHWYEYESWVRVSVYGSYKLHPYVQVSVHGLLYKDNSTRVYR